MASFSIGHQDIMIMSLTVNACIFICLVLARLLDKVMTLVDSGASPGFVMSISHRKKPTHLAQILTEQMTLWILVFLIVVALTYTTVSSLPFSHQPFPYPYLLISFILSASSARYLVMAARLVLCKETVINQHKAYETVPPSGQTGHRGLDIAYNVLSSVSSIVCLGYKQNLLFGITASIMEVSSTPLELCRLMRSSNRFSQYYRRTALICCIVSFSSRALLPIVLLVLSVRQESPLVMDNVPITSVFFMGGYFTLYHSLLLHQSIRRVLRAFNRSQCSTSSYGYASFVPFSIHDYPDVVSHDLHLGTRALGECAVERSHYQLPVQEINDCFTDSLGPKDVCLDSAGKGNDQLNVLGKKECTKYLVFH